MLTSLPFTKMHGLGNDFIMLHARDLPPLQQRSQLGPLAALLCNRHTGIGADGLIVAQPATHPEALAQFFYLNSDGSVGEMCGNGIRCFANFLVAAGHTTATTFHVDTLAGRLRLTRQPDGQVTVAMGQPHFSPERLPFNPPTDDATYQPGKVPATLSLGSGHPGSVQGWPVSMGNPHFILWDTAHDPAILGPVLEAHPAFPQKTNVEFAQRLDSTTVSLVVWERACGLTQACGTGACATVASGIAAGVLSPGQPVTVHLPGGPLLIEWSGQPTDPVWMTGPAATSFSGQLSPSLLADAKAALAEGLGGCTQWASQAVAHA